MTDDAVDTLELLDKIRRGEDVRESMERLYRIVRAALLEQIDRKLASRVQSRLDPEDLLHEAFLRGIKALDLFHPKKESAFFAWIYTIARNLMLDQMKRRSVMAVRFASSPDGDGPRASKVIARQSRPESIIHQHDVVGKLLGRLRERDREVIQLHKIQGVSFAEIGERWGKTPGAVQRLYSRAWQKLRDLAQNSSIGDA